MKQSKYRESILAIDDTPDNLALLNDTLKADYQIKVATSGEKGLSIAQSDNPPSLILLDIMMPDMDGYEVCRRLKADERTRDIPVIFLTSKSQVEDEEFGLNLGAVDYITKPLSPPILIARVKTHLRLREANNFLVDQNHILESKVLDRTRRIATVQDVTMIALGSLAETRDNETGNHIRRTQYYLKALAEKVMNIPHFKDFLNHETIDQLFKSAPLHDIGKVGVPDHILLKPGKLTAAEFEQMKQHPIYGRDAILKAEQLIDEEETFLSFAVDIAHFHHEKWDGSGYPNGLCGNDIPISARLMAVADVYDALISRRVYKEPIPHNRAMAIIKEGRGVHFDPDLADAFLEIADDVYKIAQRFSDEVSPENEGAA